MDSCNFRIKLQIIVSDSRRRIDLPSRILCLGCHVLPNRLLERRRIIWLPQVNRLVMVPNLTDVHHCGGCRGQEVVLAQLQQNSRVHLAGQNVRAEVRFLTQGSTETNTVHDVQSIDHTRDSAESTGQVRLGLGQRGDDELGEIEEELDCQNRALLCLRRERNLLLHASSSNHASHPSPTSHTCHRTIPQSQTRASRAPRTKSSPPQAGNPEPGTRHC